MPHSLLLRSFRRVACALAVVALPTGTAAAQSLPGTLVYSVPGGVIGDNATTTFTFAVDAPGTLPETGGLTVRFRGLVDPAAGDLFAFLAYAAPGEATFTRSVRLFNLAAGGFDGRSFDGSYSFGSTFTAPLPGGAAPAGDYASVETLSGAFVGRPLAGTYQVQVLDFFSNGGATIEGVDLAFDVGAASTVPEPSTVALLGGGLLAVGGVARRRRPVAA